jgi:hypothetical protein
LAVVDRAQGVDARDFQVVGDPIRVTDAVVGLLTLHVSRNASTRPRLIRQQLAYRVGEVLRVERLGQETMPGKSTGRADVLAFLAVP